MASSTLLAALLQDWRLLLTEWSLNGIISRAAQDALRLPGEPVALQQLLKRWSVGEFKELPPVVVLAGTAMPSAAGAYAIATNTIYLNADWLRNAPAEQLLDVLNEELGHYLDGLLNANDTPGDEGELFAALLKGKGVISEGKRQEALAENDHGLLQIGNETFSVEYQSYPKNLSDFRFTELSDYAYSSSCFISTSIVNTEAGDDKINGDLMESYPNIPGIWGIDNRSTIVMGKGKDSIIGRIRYNSLNPDFTPRLGDLYGIRNSGLIDTGIGDDIVEGEGLEQQTWGIYNIGSIDTSDGDDYIYGHIDSVTGSQSNYAGIINGVDSIIKTGSGNDTIQGFGLNDGTGIRNNGLIDTGSGDDIVSVLRGGLVGSGTIDLGEGNDQFVGFGTGEINGGAGIDTLVFSFDSYFIRYVAADTYGHLEK
jgi:hypothetical protein